MFGERIKPTATLPGDDSPEAIELILMGYPTACPTCGAHTRTAPHSDTGWLCNNPTCGFST